MSSKVKIAKNVESFIGKENVVDKIPTKRRYPSTMLRRLGNKTRLLPKLLNLFPDDITTFVDLFMGSGAVAFAMADRCKYVFANDNDNDIFNLFMVVKEKRHELEQAIKMMPAHESLFKYWKVHEEHDPIWRAVRFLMLSNFGYLGCHDSFRLNMSSPKTILLNTIDGAFQKLNLGNFKFICCDFRDVLKKIEFGSDRNKARTFVYADPPYLGCRNNYQNGFKESDTQDLFEMLIDSGLRFAISEFDNPTIMALTDRYGLYTNEVCTRRTINNRSTEILITNYATPKK